jgi:replicative DNA helicase
MIDMKALPNNIQAEQAVLGAMLLDKSTIDTICGIVKANDFYFAAHKDLYAAILRLQAEQKNIDIITLQTVLPKDTIPSLGGVTYLSNIMAAVPSIGAVAQYAEVVGEHSRRRSFIRTLTKSVESALDTNCDFAATLQEAEKNIYRLAVKDVGKEPVHIGDGIDATLEKIEQAHNNPVFTMGIPTGFVDLDKLIGGLQNGNLIIVAARPSMGKTAFGTALATHAASRKNITSVIFSLEMTAYQLNLRILSSEALLNSNKLKSGVLTDEECAKLARASGYLRQKPLYIDDQANKLSIIRTKCRKMKVEQNLGLVVIDYLQYIVPERQLSNRNLEIEELTRGLKELAKELDVPVVLLSQLSRAPEQRADHRPMLSDLRESGAIEQDADVVMFLYRDDYYNPDSKKKNVTEVIVAKSRDGATGTVELVWLGLFTRFADIERMRC